MKTIILFISILWSTTGLIAQQVIPLYSGFIPGSKPYSTRELMNRDSSVSRVSVPTLTIFLPETGKGNGTGVIICPGGGYSGLVMKREGYDVAREMNRNGITAFVLKYRMPNDTSMTDKSIGPLQDSQQAIMIVRQNAGKWKINPSELGIMGYSAGGHLASTAGTHFQKSYNENIGKISLRPDFMVLVYPVISMKKFGHPGSAKNLLGENPTEEKMNLFSNELQVTTETPSAFLIHGNDDSKDPVENSISFFEALRANKIPAGIHLFASGQHGFPSGEAKYNYLRYCIDWINAKSWQPVK